MRAPAAETLGRRVNYEVRAVRIAVYKTASLPLYGEPAAEHAFRRQRRTSYSVAPWRRTTAMDSCAYVLGERLAGTQIRRPKPHAPVLASWGNAT